MPVAATSSSACSVADSRAIAAPEAPAAVAAATTRASSDSLPPARADRLGEVRIARPRNDAGRVAIHVARAPASPSPASRPPSRRLHAVGGRPPLRSGSSVRAVKPPHHANSPGGREARPQCPQRPGCGGRRQLLLGEAASLGAAACACGGWSSRRSIRVANSRTSPAGTSGPVRPARAGAATRPLRRGTARRRPRPAEPARPARGPSPGRTPPRRARTRAGGPHRADSHSISARWPSASARRSHASRYRASTSPSGIAATTRSSYRSRSRPARSSRM